MRLSFAMSWIKASRQVLLEGPADSEQNSRLNPPHGQCAALNLHGLIKNAVPVDVGDWQTSVSQIVYAACSGRPVHYRPTHSVEYKACRSAKRSVQDCAVERQRTVESPPPACEVGDGERGKELRFHVIAPRISAHGTCRSYRGNCNRQVCAYASKNASLICKHRECFSLFGKFTSRGYILYNACSAFFITINSWCIIVVHRPAFAGPLGRRVQTRSFRFATQAQDRGANRRAYSQTTT